MYIFDGQPRRHKISVVDISSHACTLFWRLHITSLRYFWIPAWRRTYLQTKPDLQINHCNFPLSSYACHWNIRLQFRSILSLLSVLMLRSNNFNHQRTCSNFLHNLYPSIKVLSVSLTPNPLHISSLQLCSFSKIVENEGLKNSKFHTTIN